MELTCPKCHGVMRSYERNGVTVDQCTECRGLFLDRGELDRLIDAENRWHGEPPPAAAAPPPSGSAAGAGSTAGLGAVVGDVLRQAQASRSGYGSGSSHYGKKRKKSFLDEIFG
jgi:Zn-finger nucleic acid-binding protein